MTLLVAAIAATVAAILESTITQYLRVGDAQPHIVFVLAVIWTVAAGLDRGLVWAFVGASPSTPSLSAPSGAQRSRCSSQLAPRAFSLGRWPGFDPS